jgi:hypothetical protein
MTDTDWTELREKAEAATPGPWEHWDDREGVQGVGADDTVCQMAYLREDDHTHIPYDNARANAAFIAAANPATVLALIAEVEQLRCNQSHLEELEAALRARNEELSEALGAANAFLEEYHKFGLIIDSSVRFSERDSENAKAIGDLILRHSQAVRNARTGEDHD